MLRMPLLREGLTHNQDAVACIKKSCIYPIAKQSCLPFSSSSSHASQLFKFVHMDLWGPYKILTINGYRYFLTALDDYSRHTWIFLMCCKNDTILHLKRFLKMIRTQFGHIVKVVRSDNGGEFLNILSSGLFQEL